MMKLPHQTTYGVAETWEMEAGGALYRVHVVHEANGTALVMWDRSGTGHGAWARLVDERSRPLVWTYVEEKFGKSPAGVADVGPLTVLIAAALHRPGYGPEGEAG